MGKFKPLLFSMLCLGIACPCMKASADVVWSQSFEEENSLDGFTILNVNNDDNVWKWSEKRKVAMYNGDQCLNQANDWLMTPAITLSADQVYSFTYNARSFDVYKETLGIYIGKSPRPEDMTAVIMEPQLLQPNTKLGNMEKYIRVPESGEWYIGFHATSEAAQAYLMIDDLKIASFCSTAAPGKPELAVAPGENGRIASDILVAAPSVDMAGNRLEGTLSLSLLRQKHDHYDTAPCECPVETIWQKDGITPGSQDIVSDSGAEQGLYTYYLEASNASGTGERVAYNALIGMDVPRPVRNIAITRDEQGIVTLTWEVPKKGINDGYVKKSDLTYVVEVTQNNDYVALEKNWTECSYTYDKALWEDEKASYQFKITAKNEFGRSEGTLSPFFTSGKPYALPFHDSFDISSGKIEDMPIWIVPQVDYHSWQLMSGISHDTDNLCTVAYMGSSGVTIEMLSAELDFSQAVDPELEFWYYHTPTYGSPTLTTVVSPEYGEWEAVDELSLNSETATSEWTKVTIPLKNYADKKWIQFGWRAYSNTPLDMVYVDDITVRDKDSGISDTVADNGAGLRVIVRQGAIEMKGEGDAVIAATDGTLIYSGRVSGASTVVCDPGIYVVRTDSKSYKVVVR